MTSPPLPAGDGQAPKRRGRGRPRLLEPSPEFRARQLEIIAAAAAVFHDKGYDAGTLDDVAVALDLRRATLYHYVRSKANLLHLIFERALDRALAELDEALKIDDPATRLEALIRHQAHTITRDPTLFTVFFDHRPRLEAEYEQAIRKRERRYLQAYRAAVEAAVAAGAIGNVDPRYATQAIFGMATWSYKWFHPARDDSGAFADVCVQLVLPRRPAGR